MSGAGGAGAMLTVGFFEPKEAKDNCTWLFLGGRGSGKTTTMRSVLRDMGRDRFDVVFLIAPNKDTRDEFDCIPDAFKYSQVDPGLLSHISSVGQHLKESGKERRILVVLDDCAYDQKFSRSEAMVKELMNGRHHGITLFYSSQYLTACPPKCRDNFDYVFVGRNQNTKNRKALMEQYFTYFDHIKDFNMVLNSCTQDYGFLVCDRKTNGKLINDHIKTYRGDITLGPFMVGKKIFFELAEKYRAGGARTLPAAAAPTGAGKHSLEEHGGEEEEEPLPVGSIPLQRAGLVRLTAVKQLKRQRRPSVV